MFPHPFQMALMGYWLNQCHQQDRAEYASRLEAYARRLEHNLEAALKERAEWKDYGLDLQERMAGLAQEFQSFRREAETMEKNWMELQQELEGELRSTLEKLRNLDTAWKQLMKKHQTLVRDAAKLKKFLQDFFGEHASKLLTPLGLRHREMVLRFIQRLPDDPGESPGA